MKKLIVVIFLNLFPVIAQTNNSPLNQPVELYLIAKSATNPTGSTYFTMEKVNQVWGGNGNSYNDLITWLSEEYNYLTYSAINDNEIDLGWDFVLSNTLGNTPFGYGKYKLSVDLGNTEKYIYLDYRDDHYGFYLPYETTGHAMDVWIKFNHDNNKFYINSYSGNPNDTNWNYVDDGSTVKIWDLKGMGNPSTNKFESYAPESLTVSLSNGKPKLNWQHHLPADDYWVGYKIYRCITINNEQPNNFIEIATVGKNITSYTDNNLCFANWKNIYYKIKTKNTNRDSEFSNEVHINLTEEIINCNLTFDSDLTVPTDKILTIKNNSRLVFNSASRLIVNGTLNVNGTSSSKVTFDFISSGNSNGIWLEDNSHANINYAIIKNGYYGIRSSKSDLKVSNSDIQASNYSIYLLNYNSTSYQAEILNNKIHTISNYDIYLYNSGGKIRNNEIYGGSRGLYCNYHSSPDLGEPGTYGYNNIHNAYYGVHCYNSSNPFLGNYSCTEQGGLNTIENCTSLLIYASTNCYIDAENNWWGSDPPNSNKFYASNNSSIDYDPWHHSPPNQNSSSSSNSPEEVLFNTAFTSNSASPGVVNGTVKKYDYDPKWPIRWKLIYVRNLIFVKDYKFAVDICKSIIDENPDSSLTSYALDLLWQGSRNYDVEGFKNYLQEKTSSKVKKGLYGDMELILSSYDMGKSSKVQSIESTAQKYAGTSIEEAALFQKFMYYFNDEENTDMAKETSDELDNFLNRNLLWKPTGYLKEIPKV